LYLLWYNIYRGEKMYIIKKQEDGQLYFDFDEQEEEEKQERE
jgi:hypothetical protein